jgi:cellulose synthase/poly-beta-1,6-N-acetylglucosamine synthase-like glycosyltransferase
MNTLLTILSISSLAILIYIYIGYPILLCILSALIPAKKITKSPIRPSVSLIISCYNEEDVLREKLANSFALEYPQNKLEICVVSDASSDRTDEIAKEYSEKGVRLIRVDGRIGKTACLNVAVPQTTGEIVVFSDANAMYKSNAIGHLVENFSDDQVGYVVGEARYADANTTSAAQSEDSYWQYEMMIKKMESRLHSMVGGDGAIYAIRRELYEQLENTDINDFVNPLQIIAKGFRGIYEPEAICYEDTSGSFSKEFGRKVRIVNRSFNGLLRVKSVLNPFKTGIYSFQIISHKLLRWFSSYFLLILAISTVLLAVQGIIVFQYAAVFMATFLVLADIGYLLSAYSKIWPIFYIPYYFINVNAAAFVGINRRLRGETQIIWKHHRLTNNDQLDISLIAIMRQLLTLGLILYVAFFISRLINVNIVTSRTVFWTSFLTSFYVYLGYPVVLFLWAKCCAKPVIHGSDLPVITLVVCAYNEDDVIEDKIKNSLVIDYPKEKLHIAIASDGSTDNTNEIVKKYETKQLSFYEYQERTGKIGVILQTVPQLTSDILVFSDANTMYAPDALRKLVRNFSDPSVGGVSADVILMNKETNYGESESAYYLYERWLQQKESEIGSIIGADGGMYAIRRELFMPPAPNIILDDFVISMNVAIQGKRLVYDHEAKGYEESTISHSIEFLRKSRVIAGAVQALKQAEGIPGPSHKGLFFSFLSHKMLRWFVPLFLFAQLYANIFIVVHGGGTFYQLCLAAQGFFYFCALLGVMVGGESRFPVIGIPFYFCLVNGAALYGLYKGCFNKQPVTWKKFSRK